MDVREWVQAFGFDDDRPRPINLNWPGPRLLDGAYTYSNETNPVLVDGDAVLRDIRAFAAELRIRPAPLPEAFRITACEQMSSDRQMLNHRGQPVLICGIDQIPEGVLFDEIVVHPDRYESLIAAMEGPEANRAAQR